MFLLFAFTTIPFSTAMGWAQGLGTFADEVKKGLEIQIGMNTKVDSATQPESVQPRKMEESN